MNAITNDFEPYLEISELYDSTFSPIIDVCKVLQTQSSGETMLVKNIYEYVRDKINHTADTNEQNVACSASEVITYKHGICCAKANLFAAFLRHFNIPVGFCYQKLKSTNSNSFVLHGLNAIYLREYGKWIRLDVGGIKKESNAQFSIDEEKIAYKVNKSIGEVDHSTIFAKPNPTVIEVMKQAKNIEELWKYWSLTLSAVFNGVKINV
jgi:hypothetical protein